MIPKVLPSSLDFMGLPLVNGIERVVVFGYLGFGLGQETYTTILLGKVYDLVLFQEEPKRPTMTMRSIPDTGDDP